MKKLIIFDLDGTLAESKSALDHEMAMLIQSLLNVAQVAIISGGSWTQFEQQVLTNLPPNSPGCRYYPPAVRSFTATTRAGKNAMLTISPTAKRRRSSPLSIRQSTYPDLELLRLGVI